MKKTVPATRDTRTATTLLPGSANGYKNYWSGKPGTYYDVPLIKKAHWGWQIVLYFFFGGIAGGSYLVATLAHLFGLDRSNTITRAGRYLSFVCLLASPVLLILDLGRPARFHHMLRVFKLRSVMSLATWGLNSFGLCCGFTAAFQMAKDGLLNWFPLMARLVKALPIKVIESLGAFFGLFVASYTGVLLSSTGVPVWARARRILGPLFLTSGLSTSLSSLSLILSFLPRSQENPREARACRDCRHDDRGWPDFGSSAHAWPAQQAALQG
ncbi:NrfD/PsrC family molybdoenzyme membrane anchor subunit [Ktedonobacter robiniae]|uniref:Polysulfide reductase n=1 Tax=Ktedonobacter robiniae TaxID=2778365 RepID=A0ABQ3V0G7_9CHLR|nr:NrfD/PsrC family molybdoenzyme membrane anchor subunit [Ktedonobacter robiniae]GHO58015.1 hypothetical protein KSB_64900 [Ktedonobacter robiniae]